MKTIVLSDKTYADVLRLKNMVSMESNHITNTEVRKQLQIPEHGTWFIRENLFGNVMWEKDFEPEFTFEQFFNTLSDNIWDEQEAENFKPFNEWR